jgi:hypothetical protein
VALDRAEPVVERIEARAEVFDLPSDAVGLAWWKWAGLAALVAAMAAAVVLIWSNGRETTTLDHGAALAAEDIHPLDPVAAVPDAAPAADFADVMAAASAPAVMTPVLLPGPARTGAAPARYLRHPDSDLSTMLKKGRRTGKDEIQLKKPRL